MTKIQSAIQRRAAAPSPAAARSVGSMMNSILDGEGYRKRFDELLGKRAPQFISSLISVINSDGKLRAAFLADPTAVIVCGLKAATYDLPIEPSLGYAYIVPFGGKPTFILGYKGMNQLALRTGAYRTLNVIDVREGELKRYNRLTEEIELDFIEDEDERDRKPIIGWCGYFRLLNGTEKTVYMTKAQIDRHEQKNRKGSAPGKGWREDYDAMAAKTVFRRLIGKWGLMSIDYQKADAATLAAAEAIAKGQFDDEDALLTPEYSVAGDSGGEEDLAALAAEADREAQAAWEAERTADGITHAERSSGAV